MYYVIRDLKKKKTKQLTKTVKTTLQRNTQQQTYHRPKRRRRTGRLTRTGLTGYRFHVFHELFKYLKGIRKGKSVNWPTKRASNQNISNRRSFGYPFFNIYIQLFRDWGCRKKCTQQSRKILWVVLSSLFFQGMDVCLWVLKESNKSRFDSCSVRNSTDWSCTILPFGIVARTFFPTTFLKIAVYKNNHWSLLLLDECLNEKLIRSHHGHHAISYAMFNCFLELRTESWEVIRWDGYTLQ